MAEAIIKAPGNVAMTDSESIVSETSAVMDHEFAAYVSHDNDDANKNTALGGGVAVAEEAHDLDMLPSNVGGAVNSLTGIVDGSNAVVDGSDVPSVEHSVVETSQALASGTPLNADIGNDMGNSTSAAVTENGVAEDVHGSSAFHQPANGSALSAEEERLWSIVRANSLDFNAWIPLLEETERMSEGDITRIRKAYDAFLAEFPLCYGYWKKYADHEARIGSMDRVVEVYEQAVQGVTYSVDMWLHYCVFAMGTYGDPETIRRLFERGLAYVGTDYLSFSLWDKYIEYEYTQRDWRRVAVLYTRVLENPNQQLDRYFEGFKELVASRPLSELQTDEEAAAAALVDSGASDQTTEGETYPNSIEQSKPVSAGLKEAEELEKYIAVREEMFKKAKEFDSRMIGFETAIRRPYFHARPQSVAELENWHNYLDFIEGVGDLNKVVKLYERCLIACANYPEFWIRYVLFMKVSGSTDLAENALARATQVFLKRQPEIHLFAARFREQNGDISGARAAYQLVHTEISPGLMEAIIKHSNMERRQENIDGACSVYEHAIAIEKGKEHSQTLPLLFAQYARFLYLVSGKVEKSREILDQAVENFPLSKPLLEALIHIESFQPLPKRLDYLESLVDKFVVGSPDNPSVASVSEREELSSIFLEFLDLFGDAQSIERVDARHAKLFLPHRNTSESKKRHAEEYLISDKAKLAKSALPSAAPSVMGAYPNVQNQWPAGYGMPQGWPQAAQSQAQQWTPGYAQQAAYAYGTYGTTYPQPQVAASAPQAAAYPPTYPAQQAYNQQSYGQVAAPAALPPAQQSAAAPQAYYGSYY